MRPVSSLTSFVVSGLLAASATLFVGWPSVVDAEAPEVEAAEAASATAQAVNAPANAELRSNESKIGELIVSAELTEAAQGRTVRLECRNPTATLIAGNVHVELGRNDGIPMGRVESSPSIVWRHDEAVKVAPGETLVRNVPLPKQFTQEMNRLAKLATAAQNNPNVSVPYVYYSAMAYPVVPNTVERPGNARMASRSRMNNGVPRPMAVSLDNDLENPVAEPAPAAPAPPQKAAVRQQSASPNTASLAPMPKSKAQGRANSKTAMVGSDLRY